MADDAARTLLRLQRSRVGFTALALRSQQRDGIGLADAARLAWLYLRLRRRLKAAERLLAAPAPPQR